jgi:nitrogen fixation/metabolism regulation signal transduction histidine kinase
MSDIVWQALIAAGVTLVLAWMNQRTKNAVTSAADKAATKVEEVKDTLESHNEASADKLAEMAEVGEATHTLVNSAMGAQLRLHAATARALAEQTHLPAHTAAADLAEKLLAQHEAKQRRVDNMIAENTEK